MPWFQASSVPIGLGESIPRHHENLFAGRIETLVAWNPCDLCLCRFQAAPMPVSLPPWTGFRPTRRVRIPPESRTVRALGPFSLIPMFQVSYTNRCLDQTTISEPWSIDRWVDRYLDRSKHRNRYSEETRSLETFRTICLDTLANRFRSTSIDCFIGVMSYRSLGHLIPRHQGATSASPPNGR
jgi:hypothetical protein